MFLVLAADTMTGFNPGPSVFRFTAEVNPELIIAFGLFTTMVIANLANWTIGGMFMRFTGIMVRAPKHILMPAVLLVTLTAIYVQETRLSALWIAIGFGVVGYLFRRLGISVLPFVIAFILAGNLETTARQAFSATGGDPWFLFKSPLALLFMALAIAVIVYFSKPENSMTRPNILFVTADQQRADCFGFMGRRIKTPHLDGLAAEGTHFNACITPNVVCQPSRASILTGLLPRTHGVHDNGIDLDPALGEQGFAGTLSKADMTRPFSARRIFQPSTRSRPRARRNV